MEMMKSALDLYLEKMLRRHARWMVFEGAMKALTVFFLGVLLVWGVSYAFAEQGLERYVLPYAMQPSSISATAN